MTCEAMQALQDAQARKVYVEGDVDLHRPESLDALADALVGEADAVRLLSAQIRQSSAQLRA